MKIEEYFDKILLDVPCLGLGVLKRKPDIKWQRKEEDIEKITQIQKQILENCSKYLRKGGELVYSTCSILKEENEDIIETFVEKNKKFEIIEILSKEFNVKSLCRVMNISRSGYYKWLKSKDILNQYEKNRRDLEPIIKDIHKRKPSYGYHRINYLIRKETGWIVSDNLVHKVCKILKIRSKARHYSVYKKPGEESIKYPNLINNNWKTTRPLEKITSDTTTIWFKKQRYDWTYYVDAFDASIIGSDVKPFYHGVSMSNHKSALEDMLNNKIKRGYKSQDTIFHSDQGIIYSSVAFNNAHKDYNIIRSMSRIGTPTDNPIIESKNGWLKKEMYIDFNQDDYETVEDYINAIIYDHNYLRPSYALNYKTPIEYRTQLGFK